MSTAFGFLNLEHLYNERVTQVGVARVYEAIRESLEVHTSELDGLLRMFVRKTTLAQEQIELPGTGTLQPLTESGTPAPVRPSGSYKVSYPIQGGGTAWATDRVSQAMLTVQEANRFTWDAQRRDADWMIRHILAAIFTNVTWTFKDKAGANGAKGLGDITIQPLANNDTVTYVRRNTGQASIDNHYLAQASAIDNSNNPFSNMRNELVEHPSNSGPLVAYIPTNVRDAVGGLNEFVEYHGEGVIRVAADDDEVVSAVPDLGPGDEIVGYLKTSKFWIIEWGRLPDNYIIGQARGATTPLKMREWAAPELQGFFTETWKPDSGLNQVNLIRYAGFGVANRVSAVVQRVGNGTYAIPGDYTAPLEV